MADDQEYLNNLIDQGAGPANGEVDAEMALLALCMRKNTAVLETVENKIAEEDFTDARNRTIYSVIIDMFLDNAQIDRITVFSELERRGLADKAGGQRYVYRVGDKTAVQSALLSYIAAVRERSDRTKLLKAVDKIRTKATDGKMKASEAVDYAINEIAHLKTTGESKGFEILSTILKSTMSEITAELRDENAGGKVKVGFPKLDAMLGGLRPGSLNILAARPSMGKSALAINMAANVAAYQNPVAIFSLEMSKQEIASRLMSSTMNKSVSDIIYSRKMKDSDKQQLDRALVKLSEYPIYIDDNSDTNPVTMKSKLQQLFSDPDPNKRPKLVVIDYLQLMTMPSAGGRSRNEEVTAIFNYSDAIALKTIRYLNEARIRIPEDVSIVGFDDTIFANATNPPLTSVIHPKELLGHIAAETLISIVEHYPYTIPENLLTPKMSIKGSCAALPQKSEVTE